MKQNVLYFILLSALSSNAFALTDQIDYADNYLIAINNDISNQLNNSLNYTQVTTEKAIAPKTEIKNGHSYKILKEFQEQNGLIPTGIFSGETLEFVRQKQEELGFNVTKTLDYNTWFATFKQPLSWEAEIINNSIEQWKGIIENQKQITAENNIEPIVHTYFDENGIETLIIESNSNDNNTKYKNVSLEKFIVVNLPSMTLHTYLWDGHRAIEDFKTRVVIGRINNQTPLDSMYIWGMKYHPT